jgi:hypothetical protein
MQGISFLKKLLAAAAACCGLMGVLFASPAARADEIEITEARLNVTDDGVALAADFSFDLNARLAEVVTNGVPLYFVVEFELTRPRWYWFDEKAAAKRLQLRLSYHPLSRHYRLSTGVLQQNYATLEEALNVLRRVRNWLVVERTASLADANYEAAVRMRLDVTLLPKPFQLSAITSRELNLESNWRRFTVRPSALAPQTAPDAREPKEADAR